MWVEDKEVAAAVVAGEVVGDEDTGPFAIDERFRVGTFTHLNKVIHQGEMVRKARLNLDVTAVFDGVSRLFS